MLTKAQEKLIRSLHRKKGRRESGLCLIEGKNLIDAADDRVQFIFTRTDTNDFDKLVTTQSPQGIAGVALSPSFTLEQIREKKTIVILDGVQDPGNVGTIMRACLGFGASLILIESADPTNAKVIRSSVGTIFTVPWIEMKRAAAAAFLSKADREIFRVENREGAILHTEQTTKPAILIVGSEGSGIQLTTEAPSLKVDHDAELESLNVAQAVTVVLASRRSI